MPKKTRSKKWPGDGLIQDLFEAGQRLYAMGFDPAELLTEYLGLNERTFPITAIVPPSALARAARDPLSGQRVWCSRHGRWHAHSAERQLAVARGLGPRIKRLQKMADDAKTEEERQVWRGMIAETKKAVDRFPLAGPRRGSKNRKRRARSPKVLASVAEAQSARERMMRERPGMPRAEAEREVIPEVARRNGVTPRVMRKRLHPRTTKIIAD